MKGFVRDGSTLIWERLTIPDGAPPSPIHGVIMHRPIVEFKHFVDLQIRRQIANWGLPIRPSITLSLSIANSAVFLFESTSRTKNPFDSHLPLNDGLVDRYCDPLYNATPPQPQMLLRQQPLPVMPFGGWIDVEVTWKPDANATSSTGHL
jgi:hypothetical protein